MIYWQLFLSFIQIGLFSFGGGYAAMPLIQGQVVTLHRWLNMEEFTNLITISQMTPGPHCHQLRHLCRHENRRCPWRVGGNAGVYSPGLHSGDGAG